MRVERIPSAGVFCMKISDDLIVGSTRRRCAAPVGTRTVVVTADCPTTRLVTEPETLGATPAWAVHVTPYVGFATVTRSNRTSRAEAAFPPGTGAREKIHSRSARVTLRVFFASGSLSYARENSARA